MPALLASGANSGFISTSEASKLTDSLHFRAEVTRCLPETISDDKQAGSTERVLDLEARNPDPTVIADLEPENERDANRAGSTERVLELEARNPDPTVIADLERENERLAKLLFETTTDFAMFRKKTEGDLGAALNAQRIQDERRFAKVVEAEIRDADERAKANLDECEARRVQREDDLADAEARLIECESQRGREAEAAGDDRTELERLKAKFIEAEAKASEARSREDDADARLIECEAQRGREAEAAGDDRTELERLKAKIIEAEAKASEARSREDDRADARLNECEARIREIRREDDRADAESKARLDECGKREAKIRDDASAELERLKAEIIEANKRATTNLNVCEARIRDERLKATENRAGHLDALAESVDEIRHRQSLTDREIQNLQDASDENNNALAVLVSKYRRLQIHMERVTAAIKAGVSTCRSNVVLSIISSLVVTFLK